MERKLATTINVALLLPWLGEVTITWTKRTAMFYWLIDYSMCSVIYQVCRQYKHHKGIALQHWECPPSKLWNFQTNLGFETILFGKQKASFLLGQRSRCSVKTSDGMQCAFILSMTSWMALTSCVMAGLCPLMYSLLSVVLWDTSITNKSVYVPMVTTGLDSDFACANPVVTIKLSAQTSAWTD